MKLKPIVNSLLDTDYYKFTIGQCIYHQFNSDKTKWAFKCRNEDVKFTAEMVQEIKEQIKHYCSLSFTEDELDYLKSIKYIHDDYVDFLRYWHPRYEEFHINEYGTKKYNDCGLEIETYGTWLNTSMYEIAILEIVNEVYFSFKYGVGALDKTFMEETKKKFDKFTFGVYDIGAFSEFGTRRRLSFEMQDWLIGHIVDSTKSVSKDKCNFLGTSNVYFAKKYGVKPMGTLSHEVVMSQQGRPQYNPAYSNKFMMDAWLKEYGILPGVYLGDTITTDVFLKDFTLTYAHMFNGVRHDSGDPLKWGDKLIAHYEKLGIDPKTKTLLFSDSLDFEKATELKKYFAGRCIVAFGIGTYLAGVQGDVKPLNIVCKMVECNGLPTAKISDSPGKGMCQDDSYVSYLKRCIEWRMNH